jgi:CBS domain containing-hemolysin-like protein
MTDKSDSFWRRLRRGFTGPEGAVSHEDTEEYVEEITDKLTEQGYLNQEEAGMIRRVVEFRDRTAAEIMIPRTEIFALSSTEPFEQLLPKIRQRGHSRIPVYEGTIDNIIGILYTKDLLKLWGQPVKNGEHLKLLRPPTIVPEGKPAAELMAKFKNDRVHIAIVIDEYGGTSGLVTLEDVMEEIFGDIQDEYDREEELVTPLNDGTLLVDARLPVDRAFEMLELEEPDDERDYDTLGGFLSYLTGRIPRRGEEVSWGGRTFVVESANNRRVFKVRVLPGESATATPSAQASAQNSTSRE